ncbi:MAG TPA: calcium-binding protein, partial [Gemmataceae bacterium]|nr:calcium-binding protein [Gemmataceae bacterium]
MSRFSLLRALFRRPATVAPRPRQLRLHSLEERVTPVRDLDVFVGPGGTLTVIGATDALNRELSENILVLQDEGFLGVFYSAKPFIPVQVFEVSSLLVSKIRVEGRGGDDFIDLDFQSYGTEPINLPATVYGGQGGDAIKGTNVDDALFGFDEAFPTVDGNDVIDGKVGGDTIDGGPGNDFVYGWVGEDSLIGGTGADYIVGNHDRDTIRGGLGNDKIYGDSDRGDLTQIGDDRLFGDEDADRILGGSGGDVIDSGDGADSVLGELGDDSITTGVGNDSVRGGRGNDTISTG